MERFNISVPLSLLWARRKEKVIKIVSLCQELREKQKVSIKDLTSLIGRLTSSAIAVLPAPLQYRAMQRQQILEWGKGPILELGKNYHAEIVLSQETKEELQWWTENLRFSNGKALIRNFHHLIIASDASNQGWGAFCKGQRTGGSWNHIEKEEHINYLELKAAKLAILTFLRVFPTTKAIHLQIDNMTALAYIKKMGGTKNKKLCALSREVWEILIARKITITVEHLPGKLNLEADFQSRNVKDSSEWKLDPGLFRQFSRVRWIPTIDLFASRHSHQVSQYISWKHDPYSIGRCLSNVIRGIESVCVSPLLSNSKSSEESSSGMPKYDSHNSSLANSSLVPLGTAVISRESNSPHTVEESSKKPSGRTSSSCRRPVPSVSGMDSFKQQLYSEGISEQAADIISASRRKGNRGTNYRGRFRGRGRF